MIAEFLSFIASIFASTMGLLSACAWPVAVIFLVFILRKQIIAAIPNLTRLKAAGVEFEFGKELEKAERQANEADIPPVEDAPPDLIGPDFAWLYKLAEINSRSAIVEAWLLVETSISELAAKMDIKQPTISSPYALLQQLKEEAPISGKLFPIVDDLRQLRNQAVHELEFSPGFDETIEYVSLALRVSNALRSSMD